MDATTLDSLTIALEVIIFALIIVFYAAPFIIINWMLVKKAGKAGWSQVIPGYNYYIQGIVASRPTLAVWLGILTAIDFIVAFTPANSVVSGLLGTPILILWIIMFISLVKRFNAGAGFWVLYILLPVVGVFFVKKVQYVVPGVTPVAAPALRAPVQPPTTPPPTV